MPAQRAIGTGHWLSPPAAAAYLRMRAAGCPRAITDAGRTYREQEILYRMYLRGQLRATAARPGTSKHESGRALDLPEPARSWVRSNGAAFGWIKDTVRREPWHFEYIAAMDRRTSAPARSTAESLAVTGVWGSATTKALQRKLGTPADGVISHQIRMRQNAAITSAQFDRSKKGSSMVRELQQMLGLKDDGLCGPATIKALQRRMGTQADGLISPRSSMVKEMQRRLLDGKF